MCSKEPRRPRVKLRKGKGGLLDIDKVDEGIADVALVLEIDAKVKEVEFAEMGVVDALQQHFLTKKKKRKVISVSCHNEK